MRKIRDRKPRILKADDLLVENGTTEDWLQDLGSRRRTQVPVKPDLEIDDHTDVLPMTAVKTEPDEDLMDVDDIQGKRDIKALLQYAFFS